MRLLIEEVPPTWHQLNLNNDVTVRRQNIAVWLRCGLWELLFVPDKSKLIIKVCSIWNKCWRYRYTEMLQVRKSTYYNDKLHVGYIVLPDPFTFISVGQCSLTCLPPRFHRFPRNVTTRKRWIIAIRRDEWPSFTVILTIRTLDTSVYLPGPIEPRSAA